LIAASPRVSSVAYHVIYVCINTQQTHVYTYMYMYMYIHIHSFICMYIYIYIYMYAQTYQYLFMYICIYVYLFCILPASGFSINPFLCFPLQVRVAAHAPSAVRVPPCGIGRPGDAASLHFNPSIDIRIVPYILNSCTTFYCFSLFRHAAAHAPFADGSSPCGIPRTNLVYTPSLPRINLT